MIIKSIKYGNLLIVVFAVCLMLCFICSPSVYMQATFQGICTWATSVLPALFPFFFFTNILSNTNAIQKLSKIVAKPLKFLFNTSPNSAFVYISSLFSGYPVGAKLISDLYLNHKIDKAEAVRIHAFCSCSGPIFVVGTVGSSMFKSASVGATILIVHFLAAFLNGIVFRNYGTKQKKQQKIALEIHTQNGDILGNAIKQSVLSILIVGGYIAISFVVCTFFTETKLLTFLGMPLNFLFDTIGIGHEFSNGLLLGFVEITRGCLELSNFCALNLKAVIVLACTVISFGGISVLLQSMTFLKQCGISTKTYLLQKLSHATISAVLALVFCNFI